MNITEISRARLVYVINNEISRNEAGERKKCHEEEMLQLLLQANGKVIPADYTDVEEKEELFCDGSKDEEPSQQYLFCVNCSSGIFKCEDFNKIGYGADSENSPILILDNPICRDGTIPDRAKLTTPWPLSVRKSGIEPSKVGVWTEANLPFKLLFGPYEGVYRSEVTTHALCKGNGCPWLTHLTESFLDYSNSSLSNWLSLIATSPDGETVNLTPLLYKNCIFYQTVKVIPRNTELVVWTGKEIEQTKNLSDNYYTDDTPNPSSYIPECYQCPRCNLQFVTVEYLLEHKNHCSSRNLDLAEVVADGESSDILEDTAKEGETLRLNGENGTHLRRSTRNRIQTVRYSNSSDQSTEKSIVHKNDVKQEREPEHVCHYCKLAFTSSYTLRRHVECHSNDVKFICSHCGLSFMDEKILKYHKELHNSAEMDYPEELRIDRSLFSPRRCKSPVLVEKDYTYHLGNEKCVFDLPWVKTLLTLNKTLRSYKSTALQCDSCETQFYNKIALALHERNCLDGVKPYKCGHCAKRFQLYFSVVKHMSKHGEEEEEILATPDAIHTPLLNKTYDAAVGGSNKDCKDREISATDTENVDKEENLKSFAENPALEQFITGKDAMCKTEKIASDDVESTNAFPYDKRPLDLCDGKQSTVEDFLTKMEISEAMCGGRSRKHECNICGQRFFRRKHVKKHMELHDSETSRVFRCSFCPMWFGSPEVVQHHEGKRHEGESEIILTEEQLPREETILRKLLNVFAKESQKGRYCEYFNSKETIKDKKFECEICTKKFTSFYRIRKHKIVTHNELLDLLEAVNEMLDSEKDQLNESNILSVLSCIKEESVMEKMKELRKEVDVERQDKDVHTLSLYEQREKIEEEEEEEEEDDVKSSFSFGQELSSIYVESGDSDDAKFEEKKGGGIISETGKSLSLAQPSLINIFGQNGIQISHLFPESFYAKDEKNDEENDQNDDRDKNSNIALSQSSEQRLMSAIGLDLNRVISQSLEKTCYRTNSSYYSTAQTRDIYNDKTMKKCQICGKKLSLKTNMKTHMQSHTGERRYECTYCHNRYALLSTLKRHVRIHTNDRPFQCDVCHKAYTQSSNLKRHYRQHTGERPFRCPFCPKNYAEKFSLNRHMKCHREAKAHRCKICGRGFSEQYHLIRHINTIHVSC